MSNINIKLDWYKGRNVKSGYERSWGLQFNNLRNEVINESLYQEALSISDGRSIMSEFNRINIYLILTRYFSGFDNSSILEFGSYKAGNAAFIAYVVSKKHKNINVYAFDTFGGMPETDKRIDLHSAGDFSDISFQEVASFVANTGLSNLKLVPGLFQQSFPEFISNHQQHISFVHIDADIKSACAYAYNETVQIMPPGGYIVFDDALASSCLGATEVVEDLVIRRDGKNSEQIFPHFVFRS
jgi:hypothetical protein